MDPNITKGLEFFVYLIGSGFGGFLAALKFKKPSEAKTEECLKNCENIFITYEKALANYIGREEFTLSVNELKERIETIRKDIQTDKEHARADTVRLYDKMDELTKTILTFISANVKN